MNEQKPLGLKQWAECDRPREKMMQKGMAALTDAELLAILIGTGTRNLTAVDMARNLLDEVQGSLLKLGRMSPQDMASKLKGMGIAKSVTVAAAFELGRRKQMETPNNEVDVKSSAQAAHFFVPLLQDATHEQFWIMLLNQAGKMVAKYRLAEGGVTQTAVDPKLIFRYALNHFATGLVMCHNHPSGNLMPSQADRDFTRKVAEGARCFDIRLYDHLIVGGGHYFSFADEGLL